MSSRPASASGDGSAAAGTDAPVQIQHLPRPYQPPPLRPSLPLGVAVISVLLALGGILLLLLGALVLLNSLTGGIAIPTNILVNATIDPWGAAILIVLGGAIIAVARALWDLERWSLYLGVGATFFGLTYLFFTSEITILFLLLLGLFVYLLSVRHHFY